MCDAMREREIVITCNILGEFLVTRGYFIEMVNELRGEYEQWEYAVLSCSRGITQRSED